MKLNLACMVILLILALVFFRNVLGNKGEEEYTWCWTKPVKKTEQSNWNPSIGGANWAYCASEGSGIKGSIGRAPYRIFVETSNIAGAGSTGQFFITLFGEEGKSEEILLTTNGFSQGSTTIIRTMANNVGDVTKIRFRNGGTDSYRCNSVRVELSAKSWDFDCSDIIACPKRCFEDMVLSGNQRYELTVKTSNRLTADTMFPIFIQFIGLLGKSPKKLLSERGFPKGSTERVDLQTKDVGFVYGVILSMTQTDMWIVDQISVRRGGREDVEFLPKEVAWIKCPAKCSLTLMNPKPTQPDSPAGVAGGGTGKPESSREGKDKQEDEEEDSSDGVANDYAGGSLTAKEKNKMLRLTCSDIVKNNENFGPRFSGSIPNFEYVIAVCPPGCLKDPSTNVFGKGLHAEESGICRAAIADNAMPFSGGVIGVGVTKGLENYDKANVLNGIEIKSYARSAKSFFTYKIDNIDFIESDIRIVTYDGLISHAGRIEFRLDGEWGTVCSKGMAASAARKICRDLKYQDGEIKNPPPESDRDGSFCSNFLGEDHCGPDAMPIHYSAMNCEGNEADIMSCFREIAGSDCSHKDDVIIECSNTNYDLPQVPDTGTIRLVDDQGSPAAKGSGRLEYYKGGWGTVCNDKFDDKSAHVTCRQMGFDTGKIIGNIGQNGVCSNYEGKNYCASQSSPVLLKSVVCQGGEGTIGECSSVPAGSGCTHEEDVIIDCEGAGDSSGRSQKKGSSSISLPNLGKLPLIPIVNADCQTRGNEEIFRGDPGSIFLVNCPEGCIEQKGTIWGAGIYTSDSSICRSAIHSGVLQNMGGLIELIKMYGLSRYESTTNRFITSTLFESWPKSFVVSKPNSIAIKLSQSFGTRKPFPKRITQEEETAKGGISSFFQMSQSYWGKTIFSSFIDTGGTPKPVFQWMPDIPGYKFNGKSTYVKTAGLDGADKTAFLRAMTIAVKVEMNKSPGKEQTIVGHSGCGGYALVADPTDEVIFKARCTQNEFRSGWRLPLNTEVSLILVYDTTYVSIYIDGSLYNMQKKNFQFKCDKNLDIGSYTEVGDQVFNGGISYVQIYDFAVSTAIINEIVLNGAVAKPKGHTLANRMTLDNRKCISACTSNPIPGMPGSPNPPGNALPGRGDSSDLNEGMKDDGSSSIEMNDSASSSSSRLKCDVLASDQRFNGPTGKLFRVYCPKNCARNPNTNVFGTMIYTDDTAVCKGAIHAGFLKDEKGGDFMVVIANGEDYYASSFQNGIQSAAHGQNAKSIIYKEAPPIVKISCNSSAADQRFAGPPTTKFTVLCPKDCSKSDPLLFGDAYYTDDSSICQSAIHSGLMTDKGGEITFSIEEGKKVYASKTRNGLKSQKRGEYIRSYKIIGDKANTCQYFKEIYNPTNIFANWKVTDSLNARFGPSEWSFNTHPTQYGLSIRQSSLIQGSDSNYGTTLINKNFDCGTGVYFVNVYMESSSFAALLFRYYDENSYYALELNPPGNQKIRLVKKNEGVGEIITGITTPIVPRTWYRFRIVFYEDNLQVWLQIGNLRTLELIINTIDEDLQRGTVGVATQTNNEVYFDGIEVKDYDKINGVNDPKMEQRRVWDQCLTGANEGHRKKFCKSLQGSFAPGIQKCMVLKNYCEMCCDTIIPKIENILNYGCWRGCIREAKEQEIKARAEILAQNELESLMKNIWRPSLKEFVDYRPQNLGEKSYFMPGVVSLIDSKYLNEKNRQELKLEIEYYIANQPKKEEVIYPNPNLVECGKALQGRTDCKSTKHP